MNRIWRYRYGTWTTPWYRYVIPQAGMVDEYGRKTIVVHVPFVGFLVWAYWTCKCEDCELLRQEADAEAVVQEAESYLKEGNDATT